MKFEFFLRKIVDQRLELVRDLIEELDDLYDDMRTTDIEDRELKSDASNERQFCNYEELQNRIKLRESVINRLLEQHEH